MESVRRFGARLDLAKLIGVAVNAPKKLRGVEQELDKAKELPTPLSREEAHAKAEVMMRQIRRTTEQTGYGR